MVWGSFFYNKEELVDELWIIKYGSDLCKKDQDIDFEVLSETLAKCNVSEQIWYNLMIQMENVSLLLSASVQSHFLIAPKMTIMILKERGWPSWMVENKEVLPTPMHMAALNQGEYGADIMKVLLDNGGDPNSVNMLDPFRTTPLHYAARYESRSAVKIIKLLLERGVNPNPWGVNGGLIPIIHLVARNEGDYSHEIMMELLKHECVYDTPFNIDPLGIWLKPIHFAAINQGNAAPKLLELLIKKHKSANVISGSFGFTPLHLAVSKSSDNEQEILEKLLEKGADPNFRYEKKIHFI